MSSFIELKKWFIHFMVLYKNGMNVPAKDVPEWIENAERRDIDMSALSCFFGRNDIIDKTLLDLLPEVRTKLQKQGYPFTIVGLVKLISK